MYIGIGVFLFYSKYGIFFQFDNLRFDWVVYSLLCNGVKFVGCSVYIYEVLMVFFIEFFKKDLRRNLWVIMKVMGDNLFGYKELVKVMYFIIGVDDDEFVNIKLQWFLEMVKLFVMMIEVDLFDDVLLNFDCIVLYLLFNGVEIFLVFCGIVYNYIFVCVYIFMCLEIVFMDGSCLLLVLGIIGEVCEIGILCLGMNFYKRK